MALNRMEDLEDLAEEVFKDSDWEIAAVNYGFYATLSEDTFVDVFVKDYEVTEDHRVLGKIDKIKVVVKEGEYCHLDVARLTTNLQKLDEVLKHFRKLESTKEPIELSWSLHQEVKDTIDLLREGASIVVENNFNFVKLGDLIKAIKSDTMVTLWTLNILDQDETYRIKKCHQQ